MVWWQRPQAADVYRNSRRVARSCSMMSPRRWQSRRGPKRRRLVKENSLLGLRLHLHCLNRLALVIFRPGSQVHHARVLRRSRRATAGVSGACARASVEEENAAGTALVIVLVELVAAATVGGAAAADHAVETRGARVQP